jgi:hypothetical protein
MACKDKVGACVLITFGIVTTFTLITCIYFIIQAAIGATTALGTIHFNVSMQESVLFVPIKGITFARNSNTVGPWKVDVSVTEDNGFCQLTNFNMVITMTHSGVFDVFAQMTYVVDHRNLLWYVTLFREGEEKRQLAVCATPSHQADSNNVTTCYTRRPVYLKQDDVLAVEFERIPKMMFGNVTTYFGLTRLSPKINI